MTYLEQIAAMESGRIDRFEPLSVTLTRYEWANLLRVLHREGAQHQLGRLAWQSISSIEFELVKTPARRRDSSD